MPGAPGGGHYHDVIAGETTDTGFLSRIIATVASTLDLDRLLASIVELLSEASAVHACFVYLLEPDQDRLVLRAASTPYERLIGEVALARGEGLAWWAAERRQPAFIRDDALSDTRFKYVPELSEERFQSLVSVPILGREGPTIGVISLHTEAPREFTTAEVDFLVSSSSLVAGAIENARLHAETRRRVLQLELLNRLGERIAAADTREELYEVVVGGVAELVQPGACHLYALEAGAGADQLSLVSSIPASNGTRLSIGLAELGPELSRTRRADDALAHVPLLAGGDLRGLLELRAGARRLRADDADIVETAATQAALALVKLELIERLREETAIGDFIDALEAGSPEGSLHAQARALGVDLSANHVVLAALPEPDAALAEWAEPFERSLLRQFSGALVDTRGDVARALLPVRADGAAQLGEHLGEVIGGLAIPVFVGLSSTCLGESALAAGFAEARLALIGARVLEETSRIAHHEDLGPYKYLLRLSADQTGRDAHRAAIAKLAAYDQRRSSQLVRTLEEYLRNRGSISATATALYVHQNTLRQRLQRIEELTDMDLRSRDSLALDIAIRLAALEQAAERVEDIERLI